MKSLSSFSMVGSAIEKAFHKSQGVVDIGAQMLVVSAAVTTGLLFWRYEQTKRDVATLSYEQRELRQSEERCRALMCHASDVILIVNSAGIVQYQGPTTTTLWGYGSEALHGTAWLSLIHPEDVAHAELLFTQALECPRTNMSIESRVRYADGTWYTCEVNTNNISDDPAIDGIVVTVRDVSERKRYEEQLTRLAFHDPLSNLPNRALFTASVQHALTRANYSHKHTAVFFLDLDNFKIINDSLGHRVGDQLLIAVAEQIRASVRPTDTVARLGGDEFTVLLEDLEDVNQAIMVAERILQHLQDPFVVDGQQVFTGASIGIALSTPGHNRPDELLRNADLAMYRAKTSGKANYAVFDSSLSDLMQDRLSLETDLRNALDLGQLRIYYQPVVNLDTKAISEVEALLRWVHPQRGMISPAEFIPIAEETGMILPIGKWVLEQACHQAISWQQQFPSPSPLVMSVNLSPRQFQDPKLVQTIRDVLHTTQLAPSCLKLEITESMMMQDSITTATVLRELKHLGVELAIDDFGTGYCSLNYLKRFPVDTLKIDRSFVDGLGQNPEDTAIVRAVIAFAKALNLTVTGEGIETEYQVSELNALDCERGQGFYFSEPVPSQTLDQWLTDFRNNEVSSQTFGGIAG